MAMTQEEKIQIILAPKVAKMLNISTSTLAYWRKVNKYPELRWVEYGGAAKKRIGYYLEDVLKFQEKHISNVGKYKIYEE